MLCPDIGERDVLAHSAVHHEGDAGLLKLIDPPHHDVLFQFEARDAVGQQATAAIIAVIDRDLHTCAAQHVGGGKAAGPGTDDGDRFVTLLRRNDGFDPTFFPSGIGDVFLDRADGDGAVAGFFDDAIAFAQAVLRADASADLGEGVGGLTDLISLFQPIGRGQAQPVGDVVVQRAMALAIGDAALRAAGGLLFRLGGGIFRVDFVKILVPRVGITLFGHVTGNGYEFQHRLLGHAESSRSNFAQGSHKAK